ncbi:S8 family serine peptidase [Pseudomonadota bacterium]
MLMCITNTSAASGTSFAQLKNIQTPERQHSIIKSYRSLGQSSTSLVQMKQGTFYLDPSFVPSFTGETGYTLLQLSEALTAEQQEQLQAMGVSLLEYVPDHTWVSSISSDAVQQVHALSFVHAMGHVYPSDKLPAKLLTHGLSVRSQENQQLKLEVSFFTDVTFGQAITRLETIEATTSQTQFFSGQRLTVNLSPDKLLELTHMAIVRWIEEPAAPISPDNITSANQIGVTTLQQGPPELKGEGIVIAGWEGATPQKEHPDLVGRITVAQGGAPSNHATHVTGTLISSGENNPMARGMAPMASYVSYDFFGDIPSEMHTARLSHHANLNNHSWGYISGWSDDYYQNGIWAWFGHPSETEDSDFGRYGTSSQAWDTFIAATDSVVVKSAGNNRNDDGPSSAEGHHHQGDSSTLFYDSHNSDGNYDSIDTAGAAKNVITVGAVDSAGNISSFSGWGPADDGRIKPDVVANGLSVYSTLSNSNYGSMSGSSMSTPAVTGALALISELHNDIYGHPLGGATAKALIAHTAIDKGISGPDYSYGWGVMDASAAANILKDDNGNGRFLRKLQADQSSAYTYPISVAEDDHELKATIAWSDAAATPYAAKALVNDLDLELVDPNGNIHYPFTLSGLENPSAPANQDRPNRLDNVEQVMVIDPVAGEWEVRVRGHSIQNKQEFTLVSTTGLGNGIESAETINDTSAATSGGGGGGSLGISVLLPLIGAGFISRRPNLYR